ncbi:MAG: sulfotransferase [Cyanobium sp.]
MKTFVLGVGAQKAGTTWLHDYLHARSDADFGFCKEYHIHDARALERLNSFRPYEEGSRLGRFWRKLGLLAKPRTRRRLGFYRHPERYYAYFQSLLAQPGITISGDITPSYSQLEAKDLRQISSEIKARGLQLRTIFLLRDPVERIISSVRMNLRKKGQLQAEQEIQALRRAVIRKPRGIDGRSNYRHTLEALDRAFGLENVYVGFYESLFREDSIRSLCAYLEIPYRPADFEKRLNVSATDTGLPDDLMEALGAWQRDTWTYCQARFPDRDLEHLWPTANRWCAQDSPGAGTPSPKA